MNLYLLRHGLAVELGPHTLAKDSERLLTPKGMRKMREVGQAIDGLGLEFDLILSSPYLRARQTAEIVARTLKAEKKLQFTDALTPGAKAKEVIVQINATSPKPESVLLVGHEPFLSELISLLLSGDSGLPITLKKGGLCSLAVDSLKAGRCATLEWLLTPKQMGRMA
jgi:phosphohistidine phosphatase